MKFIKTSICVVILSSLAGCSSISQKNDFTSVNEPLNKGDLLTAQLNAEKLAGKINPKTGKTEKLLWTLEAGTLNYIEGNDKRSIMYFDSAEKEFKTQNSESTATNASENVTAVLVNEAILDYEPTQYDMVFANYYKAMSFWSIHDIKSARIEFNRAADRQRRAAEHFAALISKKQKLAQSETNKQFNYSKIMQSMDSNINANTNMQGSQWDAYKNYINPAVTYSNALFFMLEGNSKADYRKAVASLKRVYGISKNAAVKTDLQMAKKLARGTNKKSFKPAIWVIQEDGLAPKKEEFRFNLPIFLLTGKAQVASFALPKMTNGTPAFETITIDNFSTQEIANISKIIKAEFKKELPLITSRAVASTLSKIAMQAVSAQIAKNDTSGFGSMMQLGASLYSIATTSADIRTNTALPNSVKVTRIPKKEHLTLTAGEFKIPVTTDPQAKYSIIYVRSINKNIKPIVSIINI